MLEVVRVRDLPLLKNLKELSDIASAMSVSDKKELQSVQEFTTEILRRDFYDILNDWKMMTSSTNIEGGVIVVPNEHLPSKLKSVDKKGIVFIHGEELETPLTSVLTRSYESIGNVAVDPVNIVKGMIEAVLISQCRSTLIGRAVEFVFGYEQIRSRVSDKVERLLSHYSTYYSR